MSNTNIPVRINADGTLTLPACVVEALGYKDESAIDLSVSLIQRDICCDENELFISRRCADTGCSGYSAEGGKLNIPACFLSDAEITPDEDMTVWAAAGALILTPASLFGGELPIELCSVLNDLGVSPMSVRVIRRREDMTSRRR